jgi:hypothetical protein
VLATDDLHAEYREYLMTMCDHGCDCIALAFADWLKTLV